MFSQHIGKRKSNVAALPCRKSLRFNPIGQEASPTVIIRGTARLFHQVSSKSGECAERAGAQFYCDFGFI